jgi:hypothetical protein
MAMLLAFYLANAAAKAIQKGIICWGDCLKNCYLKNVPQYMLKNEGVLKKEKITTFKRMVPDIYI